MINIGPNTQDCLFVDSFGAHPQERGWIQQRTSDLSMLRLVPRDVQFVFCTRTPGGRVKQEEKFNLPFN